MTRKLLEAVEDWKLEAKLEDNDRYFYHVRVVDRLESGSRSYVIGRKGTGKTAICEYLNKKKGHDVFSQKLSFKNFPFNTLYELTNEKYNHPNQYITLWKYVIYSSIAKLMIKNQNINQSIREKLEEVYKLDIPTSLSSNVSRWTGVNFNLSVLDIGGIGAGADKQTGKNNTEWIDRVELLERLLLEHLDDSNYIIIFDELDEDYKDIIISDRHSQYTALLTSLFKSVQDIKAVFRESNPKILPIIFLRDDIYDLLQDPDKTKWNDLRVNLDWDENNIKNMLAFRLSKALNSSGKILTFNQAWHSLFVNKDVGYGNRQSKRTSSFKYITRSTQLRPRDYIRYLQVAAEETLSHPSQTKITPTTILRVDKAFSNYLRSELEDEIHGVLPEIKGILDIFSKLRKQTLSIQEFSKEYEKAIENGELVKRSTEFVLRILFHFSVIGNQPKQKNIQVFRYSRPDANLNLKEHIVVHRGLYKSLQIL